MDETKFKGLTKLYDLKYDLKMKRCSKSKQSKYFKRTDHIMENPYDYIYGMNNYLYIKGNGNTQDSYICIGRKYPSPTGRPSNKHPYSVPIYKFYSNNSLARCFKLNNLRFKTSSVLHFGGEK